MRKETGVSAGWDAPTTSSLIGMMTTPTIVRRASQGSERVPPSEMNSAILGRYNADAIARTKAIVTKAIAFRIGSAKPQVGRGILAGLVLAGP